MDKEAETKKLEDAQEVIVRWQEHPITTELAREADERKEALLSVICQNSIVDVQSFFAHFEAVGALQELRRRDAMVPAKLDEIQDHLKAL